LKVAAAGAVLMHVSVYVTFPDAETARRICRALVEERLVACASFTPVESLYEWEGRLEDVREVAAFCKTRATLVDHVAARVKELHPYEVPCVVAIPLVGGHAPYLAWIDAQTRMP
jgi:periplasmic divalent cation tolerance protein